MQWAGDEDPQELIAEGLALMNEGEIEEASFVLEEAYDFATGVTFDEAGFFFSYSLYLLDEIEYALDVLAEIDPSTDAPYYTDYVLVAAELQLSDGDSREAEELLSGLLAARPSLTDEDPFSAQSVHYLFGRALSERATSQAAEPFRVAADIAPGRAVSWRRHQTGPHDYRQPHQRKIRCRRGGGVCLLPSMWPSTTLMKPKSPHCHLFPSNSRSVVPDSANRRSSQ